MIKTPLNGFVALIAASMALSGCSADAFNAINTQLKDVKSASAKLSGAALPAAAMASNLAMIEMATALAADTQNKLSAGKLGGIIGAGSGNIIGAGSGNIIGAGSGNLVAAPSFSVLADAQASASASASADALTKDINIPEADTGHGSIKTSKHNKALIDAEFVYVRSKTSDGYRYVISKLSGNTNGFTITDGAGTYDLHEPNGGTAVNGQIPFNFGLDCTASLSQSDQVFNLSKLHISAAYPFAGGKQDLGDLEMKQAGAGSISAHAQIEASVVTATGTLKDAAGHVLYNVTMDENGLKTTDGVSASGGASASPSPAASAAAN